MRKAGIKLALLLEMLIMELDSRAAALQGKDLWWQYHSKEFPTLYTTSHSHPHTTACQLSRLTQLPMGTAANPSTAIIQVKNNLHMCAELFWFRLGPGFVFQFFVGFFFWAGGWHRSVCDKFAGVAVLDTGPSHWTQISYPVQNPVVSIHLYLIPTFTFGSSTSVLNLPEKGCCSNGIEQERKSLPEWLLNSTCNGSARPSGRTHHTTGKATRTIKATHALLHKEWGDKVVEKHHHLHCSDTAPSVTTGYLWQILCQMCLGRWCYSPTTGIQCTCTSFRRHSWADATHIPHQQTHAGSSKTVGHEMKAACDHS